MRVRIASKTFGGDKLRNIRVLVDGELHDVDHSALAKLRGGPARAVLRASVEALQKTLRDFEKDLLAGPGAGDVYEGFVRERYKRLESEFVTTKALAERCLADTDPARLHD